MYFSNNLLSFIKKDIYLVSWKSFLYAVIIGRNIHKGLFLSIFSANKIFKSLFTKRDLIRYYYFINIYIFYWNRSFMVKVCFWISILPNFIIFFFFIYAFKIFFNVFNLQFFTFFIMFHFFQSNQHFALN